MAASDFKCSEIKIAYEPGTERDVYARWSFPSKYEKESVLDKFEYAWLYKVNVRIKNKDGTITETPEERTGEEGEISYTKGVTSYEKTWSPPENTRQVSFKIRAVKKATKNNDTETVDRGPWATYTDNQGKHWFPIGSTNLPTQKLTADNITFILINTQERTVAQATWNTEGAEGHWGDTYLAGWEYVFRYKKDGTYQEGQSDTIHRDARHIDYQLEPNTSAVKFKIKPVPVAQYFVGGDSPWKEITIKRTDRTPKTDNIEISLVAMSDRSWLIKWFLEDDTTGITGFTLEWQYLRGTSTTGAWQTVHQEPIDGTSYVEEERTIKKWDPGTKTTKTKKNKYKIWSFTVENLDESATELRVRIKPTSNLDNITYNEVWSDWKSESTKIKPRSVSNVKLSMVPKSKNSVKAEWGIKNKEGVASFSYEWQYKTSGSNWQPGTNGTLDRNTYKDGQDGTPYWYVYYSVPDDTSAVRFRVNPVPQYSGSFSSAIESFTELNISVPKYRVASQEIHIVDPQTGTIVANWDEKLVNETGTTVKATIDSYEFLWRYTLRSNDTFHIDGSSGTTTTTKATYNPPENVAVVEFNVRPKPKYEFEFEGDYNSWSKFKYSDIPTNAATNITLEFTAHDNRKVDATWGVEDVFWSGGTSGIASFECTWEYRTKYEGYRYPGKTETVNYSSFIESQVISGGARRGTKWLSQYDYPENAYQIIFRVKPVPVSYLTFRGSESSNVTFKWESKIKKREVTNLVIKPYNNLLNRQIYAQWNLANRNDLDGYEIRWMFLIGDDPTDPDSWWYDSTTAEDTIDMRTQPYPIPENSKFVNVEVRPVPLYESSFEGVWVRPEAPYFELIAQTIKVDYNTILLSKFAPDSRKLIATWEHPDFIPESYDVQWGYYQNSVWFNQSAESIPYDADPLQDDYDSPEEAEWVRVRVKPGYDANDPTKNPEWSGYKEIEWDIRPNNIENLVIEQDQGTRTMIASWTCTILNGLDSFEYKWRYMYNYKWFDGSSGSTSGDSPACTYDVPDNAQKVGISVRAVPVASTYFIGEWSIEEIADAPSILTPEAPQTPTLSLQGFTLTLTVDSYDVNTSSVEYEILSDSEDGEYVYWIVDTPVTFNRSTFSVLVEVGHTYRARARGLNVFGDAGEWSQYSDSVSTIPEAVRSPIDIYGTSDMTVLLTWHTALGVTTENGGKYTVEHAAKQSYFEQARSQVHSEEVPSPSDAQAQWVTAEIFGLDYSEDGRYFFRIRGENQQGSGEWSNIVSTVVGKTPDAPTTWSSTTTATADRDVYLFWVHNSEDNSKEQAAELSIDVNGTVTSVLKPKDPDDDTTSYYLIPGGTYSAGAKIRWKVRTKGAVLEYGDWSIERVVDIYAPPTLMLYPLNGISNGALISYPFIFQAVPGPVSQTAIGYSVSIISNSSYDGWDDMGVVKKVRAGEVVYNKYYVQGTWATPAAGIAVAGASKLYSNTGAIFTINPGDAALADMMSYTLKVVVSMDSGLSAEATYNFNVRWDDKNYYLDAEMGLRKDNLSMYIVPFCYDDSDALAADVTLSVYRREFDGSFTLIGDNLFNDKITTIIDPHPALDYARYRLVYRSNLTGVVDYYDLPNYPINETSIVLQWNETWSSFSRVDEDELTNNPHSGSFLKLPFNVKIADSNTVDSNLVEYIGRKHPVSYYGTQVGQKLTLNADIAMTDIDTVYALRRLAVWMGDVYVREPSGSGYWAKVEVSFSQTRTEVTIPVTLNVTRVEGGA